MTDLVAFRGNKQDTFRTIVRVEAYEQHIQYNTIFLCNVYFLFGYIEHTLILSQIFYFSIKSKTYNPLKEHSLQVLEGLEDEEEIGEGQKNVVIKKKDFLEEHNKLIPLLQYGSKKQRRNEALDQMNELNKIMRD